ncbi:hypothetical protein ACI780_24195 [Geodermatophilus sp. SYSU D00814]
MTTFLIVMGAVAVLALLVKAASATSAQQAAASATALGPTLPRANVQQLLDRLFYGLEVVGAQKSTILLAEERHPAERGELVIGTRRIHFVAYDKAGYGIAGICSFEMTDVLAVRRKSQDVLIIFVDEPNPTGLLGTNRPPAVTTRFAFRMDNVAGWLETFAKQHKTSSYHDFDNYSDDELMEQPIVDWTQTIALYQK